MSVVWLAVDDDAGPASMRGYVERNAIALLSEFAREPIDPPSDGWLGRLCSAERVVASGLWNVNHVELVHEPEFVSVFERLVLGAPRCS